MAQPQFLPIQIIMEEYKQIAILIFQKLILESKGYLILDYSQLRSCNPERSRGASSSSQGQQVMLRTTYTEVPQHSR
jgi:hypothetical protein